MDSGFTKEELDELITDQVEGSLWLKVRWTEEAVTQGYVDRESAAKDYWICNYFWNEGLGHNSFYDSDGDVRLHDKQDQGSNWNYVNISHLNHAFPDPGPLESLTDIESFLNGR